MDWRGGVRVGMQVVGVAVIVFAVLYLAAFELPLTGLLTFERNVTVSVQAMQGGDISHFDVDQTIQIGNSTFIDVELANTGSVPADATYDLEVYDSNNTLLYTYPGPNRTLEPGSILARTVRHTPHNTGIYVIRLRAEVGGQQLQSAQFLSVRDRPEPDVPDTITITRKRVRYVYGPEPEPPEIPTRSWQVEAPRTMTMEQNGSVTLPIQIRNTGETSERNVRLSLQSSANVSIEYEPKILFNIPAGTARNFLLTVTSDGTLENQTITYTVASEDLSHTGETTIDIVPSATAAQLRQELEKLRLLISDAEAELAGLDADGLDVSGPRSDLADVKESVTDIEDYIETEEFDAAQAEIDTARKAISSVFQRLFKLQSEQLVVEAPLVQPVYLLIAASILIAVLMVGGYYYVKEKHEKRPKLLRDMEEEV
jgi:hypothetical protein